MLFRSIESKYNQLSELLSTLRIYDPYTVEMFTSFIGLLPEVGYIMELDFDHVEATISCQVRFDHYREAGYFQSRLQNASWTTDVLLTAVEHIDDLPVTRYDASYEIQLKRESWVSEKIREALGGMDQLSLEAKEDTQDE